MSSGKRYKFQSTQFRILTSYDETSPGPLTVTNITQANPAVATLNDTSSLGSTDDVTTLKLASVEGMVELEDKALLVQIINGTSVRLLGINSSGYGAFSGSAVAYPPNFSAWCEVTGYNRQGGASAEIEVTTNCSEAAEFESSYPDYGTLQLDYNFAPSTAIMQALDFWDSSKEHMVIHIVLPNSGGETFHMGYISQTSEGAQRGGVHTGSLTQRLTGSIVRVVS